MFDIESLLSYGGMALVFLTVYGQTGLLFCFFLPSGGLMFTAGVFIANGKLDTNLFTACIILTIAAILGNITGYWLGFKTGPLLNQRKDSRFYQGRHLQAAREFYGRHGGTALIAGFFFPVIRTFSPMVAGMIKMNLQRFLLFTIIGSMAWITCFVSAGYAVGRLPLLKPYLNFIVPAIIIIVTFPMLIRIFKIFRKPVK